MKRVRNILRKRPEVIQPDLTKSTTSPMDVDAENHHVEQAPSAACVLIDDTASQDPAETGSSCSSTSQVNHSTGTTPLHERFHVSQQLLGKGSYGQVLAATDLRTGESVAVKVSTRPDISLHQEVDALQSVCVAGLPEEAYTPNSHVVRFVAASPGQGVMVTEMCGDGSTLLDLLRIKGDSPEEHFSEKEAWRMFRQVAAAVFECHSAGVAHRDIKPENVLVAGFDPTGAPVLKLTDFGFSVKVRNSRSEPPRRLNTHPGTFSHAAPELLNGQIYDPLAADVWALAVVLYTLITNYMPYGAADTPANRQRVRAGQPQYERRTVTVPPLVRDLLQQMFSLNPDGRPTIDQVLASPWVANKPL